MKHIFLNVIIASATVLGSVACSSGLSENEALNRQAAEEYLIPIRPGNGIDKPYWNTYSIKFTYAPAFDFPEYKKAYGYLFTVYLDNQLWQKPASQKPGRRDINTAPKYIPDNAPHWSFKASSPKSSLAPIWADLPQGNMVLKVEALDRKGNAIATVGSRKFLRDFPFTAPARPAARGYLESALMALKYAHDYIAIKCWRDGDAPDMSFQYNSYACKTIGSVLQMEALVARYIPRLKNEAITTARNAAAFLMESAFPEGSPLAYFPPTYIGNNAAAGDEENSNATMTMEALYPAMGYLDLYDLTGDEVYLKEAGHIADTYMALQAADGSIPRKVYCDSGNPVDEGKAMLGKLLIFLKRMHDSYGIVKYDGFIRNGEKWMEENPYRTMDFTPQFEDVTTVGWTPYEDFTNCTAAPYASYLLSYGNSVRKDVISTCKDILAICEDQLVFWDTLCDEDGARQYFTPCVMEQFTYRMAIDDSACNMANAWLDYYNVTGDKLALAKCTAMVNSITNAQHAESGFIPTFWNCGIEEPFINCMYESVRMLLRFHEQFPTGTADDGDAVRRVFIAGDSTASDYSEYRHSARPRTGWGEMFQEFFGDSTVVVNMAKSGRSSKSFIAEGYWQSLIENVRPGDVVLLQFGHNDGHVDDTSRFAAPFGAFKDYQRRFITEVRDKGATPVLLTSTCKCKFKNGIFTDGVSEYAQASRQVAEEMGVQLVDIEKIMKSWLEGLGEQRSIDYFCDWTKEECGAAEDRHDITHLNYCGAYEVASMVAGGLKSAGVEPVCNWLSKDDSEEYREYDIYIAIGRDNMAGRGYMCQSDTHPVDGVWLLDDSGRPVKARNPFNMYSSARGRLMADQMSPSCSFAQAMHGYSGNRILMVVNAAPGSSIDDWAEGGKLFNETVDRALQAKKYGNIKGIIWFEECSDMANDPIAYSSRLNEMIGAFKTALDDWSLPFIVGGMPEWTEGAYAVNEHLRSSLGRMKNCGLASTRWLSSRDGTGSPLLDRMSQMMLGERYAVKMQGIFDAMPDAETAE